MTFAEVLEEVAGSEILAVVIGVYGWDGYK